MSLELSTRLGQPAFVVPSEGEEARALAGWIALAVLSLAALVAALTGLSVLVIWRLGFGVPAASARLQRIEFGPDGFAR